MNSKLVDSDFFIIKQGLLWILLVSCIFEIVLYPGVNSFLLSFTSLSSLFIFNNYVFKRGICKRYPIAVFALLNAFLFMYLPIPITLMDGRPADHDLIMPIPTFLLQFLYFIITIISFRYAIRHKDKIIRLSVFLSKHGYFPKVSTNILWYIGFMGCIPRLILMITHTEHGAGVLALFSCFMYAPICILFMPLLGGCPCKKSTKYKIYIYVIAIMILLIGTNARHYMITPVIIILGGITFNFFLKSKTSSIISFKKSLVAILAILIATGPLSDIATAMVLVRGIRGDVTFTELLKETIIQYQDKESLEKFRDLAEQAMEGDSSRGSLEWDEHYVSNVFLERFCNYRVVDASLFHAVRLGFANSKMINVFVYELLRLPPSPIPMLYGIDKSDERFSQMDYLYAYSTNTKPYTSLRVGGDVGLGLATMGILYFFIQFLVYSFMFRLFCSFSIPSPNGIIISLFALMQLMDYFNLLTVHSGIVRHVGFLGWSFWWNTFLLLLVYNIIQFVLTSSKCKYDEASHVASK